MFSPYNTYQQPFDAATYDDEPTDEQIRVLARALAHYCSTYTDVRVLDAVVQDVIDSNALSVAPLAADEVDRIVAVFPGVVR